ncbi:hypothetical protein JCM8208_002041 [Rhodotorula glutinis]
MASSAPPAPPNANDRLFQGVTFFITTTVHPDVRAALTDLLTTWGASPCPPPPTSTAPTSTSTSSSSTTTTTTTSAPRPPRFDPALVTHVITDTLDFPEHALVVVKRRAEAGARATAAGGEETGVEVVTPAWVTRSFDLQVIQPPRFYSADRNLFFSGTIVCTSELPEPDTLAVHSAVLALGGQTRRELTREVTHLVCAAAHGQKYEMALRFGTELGIVVVLPHWFEESLKLSTLVPIDIYRFPSPPFSTTLRALPSGTSRPTTTTTTAAPSVTITPFATRLHDYWRARLAHSSTTTATAGETGPAPATEPNTATAVILGSRRGGAIGGGRSARDDDEAYVAAAGAGAGLPELARAGGAGRGRRGPFDGTRVYLASDLGINPGLERALRARVRDAGGECWSFASAGSGAAAGRRRSGSGVGSGAGDEGEVDEEGEEEEEEEGEEEEGVGEGDRAGRRRAKRGSTADRDDAWAKRLKAEKRLRASDIVVLRTREGWEYWTAYDANLTIGNIAYLFHCLATSSLPSPLSRLLHYPLPSMHGLSAWRGHDVVMTVSNYAGPARDYVRALIEALGARFEGTMSKGTSYVVSASEFGSKVQHARTWELPLVTHFWLEALLLEWRVVPPTAHPSYTLSGSSTSTAGSASATHFTTLLGDTAWTREGIDRWANMDEQREARAQATRDVRDLKREEEEQLRSAAGAEAADAEDEMDEAGLRARRGGSEPARGAVAATRSASPVPAPAPAPAPPSTAKVAKARRTRSPSPAAAAHLPTPAKPPPPPPAAAPPKRAPSSSPSPSPSPVPSAAPAVAPVEKAEPDTEAAAAAPASKGKEREPLQPQPEPRRSVTREPEEEEEEEEEEEDEPEAMDVDEQDEEEDKAPLETPPKRSKKDKKGDKEKKKKGKDKEDGKAKAKSSKKVVREPSSPLSDPPRSASPAQPASSSSSSDESPPPSAKAMGKTFALISDANLVVGGSKRGAAAKARAALVAQMGDRNAYEQELKSSGRKGGAGGGGVGTRRSRSPRKASVRVKDEESEEEEEGAAAGARSDGDEEDEPEGVVKRRKKATGAAEGDKALTRKKGKRSAKAARGDGDGDEDDELEDDDKPKKKKAKVGGGPAHKGVKAVQASATTTQDPGAVSSFDKPPNAKPPAPVAKKIRIISTGLQLDKSAPDIKALKSLGAAWTDRPSEATHLVVKAMSRTEKFLCCLPFAPIIVDRRWIDACLSANKLVDEAPYLLKDKKKEAEIGDTLEAILGRARKGKLFGGRSVYVTRGVQPDCATMQRILQAAGAVVHVKDLSRTLKKIADDPSALVVSAPSDRREWDKLVQPPYSRPVYSVEAVFASVMHMDLKRGFTPDNRVDPQLRDD